MKYIVVFYLILHMTTQGSKNGKPVPNLQGLPERRDSIFTNGDSARRFYNNKYLVWVNRRGPEGQKPCIDSVKARSWRQLGTPGKCACIDSNTKANRPRRQL
jgi:hypothetical protein